jgi:hypothetical protein
VDWRWATVDLAAVFVGLPDLWCITGEHWLRRY